jgi:hypothetical protein
MVSSCAVTARGSSSDRASRTGFHASVTPRPIRAVHATAAVFRANRPIRLRSRRSLSFTLSEPIDRGRTFARRLNGQDLSHYVSDG